MIKKKTTSFFEKMSKTKSISEKQLREAIRRMVRKTINEAEEEKPVVPEVPQAKPEAPKPEPAPEEEAGLSGDFQTATTAFIRKLASAGTPSKEDLVDIISQVLDHFTTTSEERLSLLKGVHSNIVH